MEQQFMKEVDDEIQKILLKNKQKIQPETYCTSKNLNDCLEELSLEFDYLDVSCMDENIDISNSKLLKRTMIQLVNSSHNLLKLYKEANKEQSDKFEKNSKLFSDHKSLIKTVENLRKDLDTKEKQLQINKEKVILEKIENTDLKNKITDAKKEISSIQKDIVSEKNRHKNEINKVLDQNRVLQERFRKNCGEYVSKEGKIVEVLDSYKRNEEKYVKMVEKLQENNQLLLEEILHLKGEIALAGFKQRSD